MFVKYVMYQKMKNAKIKINEPIPIDWNLGKKDFELEYLKNKKKQENEIIKNIKIQERKEQYNEYYKIYKEVGLDEFIKKVNYKFVKGNLFKYFKIYVDDYIPNNIKLSSRFKNVAVV